MRRRLIALSCCLLAAMAGCARSGAPGASPQLGAAAPGAGAPRDSIGYTGPNDLGTACGSTGVAQPPATQTFTPLPDDFVIAAATRCTLSIEPVPGDGEWLVRHEQRADGGLDALARALRQPSAVAGTNVACPDIATVPIVITLVDPDGRRIVPAIPHDACQMPLPSVLDAIRAAPWRTVTSTKVSRTASQLELDSGCGGSFKPVIEFQAIEGRRADPAASAAVPRSTPLVVCRYTLDPDGSSGRLATGVLAAASTVDGAEAEQLLAALAAAAPVSGACAQEQSPFAVIAAKDRTGPYVAIELGGCRRMLDGNNVLRQLDAATVALAGG